MNCGSVVFMIERFYLAVIEFSIPNDSKEHIVRMVSNQAVRPPLSNTRLARDQTGPDCQGAIVGGPMRRAQIALSTVDSREIVAVRGSLQFDWSCHPRRDGNALSSWRVADNHHDVACPPLGVDSKVNLAHADVRQVVGMGVGVCVVLCWCDVVLVARLRTVVVVIAVEIAFDSIVSGTIYNVEETAVRLGFRSAAAHLRMACVRPVLRLAPDLSLGVDRRLALLGVGVV